MTEYKIIEHMSFDWMVVTYFFLGGISAGSFIFSVVANYWKTEFKPLAKTAAFLAPISLAMGMFFLLIDLGMPLRAWRLFLNFNPTSALSWGVWFLNIFFVLSSLFAWSFIKGQDENSKRIAFAGIPFSLLVASYTGILLAQAPGRLLWHSALNPLLFLLGGLISGIALVMLVAGKKLESTQAGKLSKFLAGLLLLEVGLILTEIIVLFNGDAESVNVAKHIVWGSYSFLFLVVEIIMGAIVPVYLIFRVKLSPSIQALVPILILMGIYAMRYIVVIGGQVPSF